jgi:hypothetical protein
LNQSTNAIQADKQSAAEKERAFGGFNPEAAYTVANSIRKSSICFPT